MVAILAFLVGAGLGLAILPGARDLLRPRSDSRPAAIGGPFELIDHTGRTVTQADFRGRYMLVGFGHIGSNDATPAQLQLMAAALEKLGRRADEIVPVFVTLDPERDSPAELAAWVGRFHPRLVGLGGTKAAVESMARAWKVPLRGTSMADSDAIGSSALLYLMGPDGSYRAHFGSFMDVKEFVRGLAVELNVN